MKKIFYFDTETTGLDPVTNEIIQIAGIIVINGKVEEEFEYFVAPTDYDNISQGALDIHGYQIDQLKNFPPASEVYSKLINILSNHIDKYNRDDKFTPAGYNANFDIGFLQNFFKRQNDKFYGSWFNHRTLDPLPVLRFLSFCNQLPVADHKLGTICQYFNIELDAHDALSDIRATRKLLEILYMKYFPALPMEAAHAG